MEKMMRLYLASLIVSLACTSMFCDASTNIRGGYYPEWALDSDYPASSIDTTLFSHIFYAFILPNEATFAFDVSASTASKYTGFTSTLHSKNPSVKILLSIGGGGSNPAFYANMASRQSSRKTFIDSSIRVARAYNFDGLDLDWESPANQNEMNNLGLLFKEWRAAINVEARSSGKSPLLLTAAVYFSVAFFLEDNRKYPVSSINENVDWINAMCYDYHGSWDTSATGAHATLYDPTNSKVSTSYGLTSWVNAGLLRNKVVMGLPLYGRAWKLKDAGVHGIGAPSVGVGPGEDGILTYAEIENFNAANSATVVYDEETVSTYSYADVSWIGYDGVQSTNGKVRYARGLGLGGYFFWAINQDPNSKITSQASSTWNS